MAERLTLARPYAEAVFKMAQEENDLAGWSALLQGLAQMAADNLMKDVFTNPEYTDEAVFGLVSDIFGKTSTKEQNFIRVLIENNRLILSPEIFSLFAARRAQAEASQDVEVTSAFKLDAKQEASLATMLEKKLGKKINLTSSVDESLIGGVVIHAGDLVIDGSVKGHLGDLSSQLTH